VQLQGTVVIITGAGRGIGRAIAKEFAAQGAKVALASRTLSQLEETDREIKKAGGHSIMVPTDVSDRRAVEAMVKKVEKELGSVDTLLNNAGSFTAIGPVYEVDPDKWWQDVTVNLYGAFLCCRSVLPGMIARKEGRIINMIGGGTGTPFAYGSGYGSSKAALMRFTECLAMEVKEGGIKVFAMGPGLVRTAMTEYQLVSPEGKKWLSRIDDMFAKRQDVPPERAAKLAVFIASGKVDALTGRMFGVNDDLEKIAGQVDEILKNDLRTLRFRQ
jgi:NAD(P)-dependent dehydrogenase (short-subunit alcohol dehydrogenase family)